VEGGRGRGSRSRVQEREHEESHQEREQKEERAESADGDANEKAREGLRSNDFVFQLRLAPTLMTTSPRLRHDHEQKDETDERRVDRMRRRYGSKGKDSRSRGARRMRRDANEEEMRTEEQQKDERD
jgi:hypothetical protein